MRIDTIELPRAQRQVAFDGFNQNMVMIVHQAPSMASPVEPGTHLAKYLQPDDSVMVIMEDVLPPIPTRSGMVDGARIFDSEWSGHGKTLTAKMLDCKPPPNFTTRLRFISAASLTFDLKATLG